MTTTVKAGTNRPAAKAKTARDAQRTELPGDAPAGKPLDEMTVAELRQAARDLGLSSTTRLAKKAELIAAIEKARRTPPTAPKPPRRLGTLAEEAAKAPDAGAAKAEALAAFLVSHNWASKVSKVGAAVKVIAKRGEEVLTIVWTSGTYDYAASSYTNGERSRKCLNVSAAKSMCTGRPPGPVS